MAAVGRTSFGLKALKKHPELIPLVSIIGAALVGATAFSGYALMTKPDVRIVRSRGPAHEDVSPEEYRKLIRVGQKIEPKPEIEKLRKEIGSYKS